MIPGARESLGHAKHQVRDEYISRSRAGGNPVAKRIGATTTRHGPSFPSFIVLHKSPIQKLKPFSESFEQEATEKTESKPLFSLLSYVQI